MQLARIRATPLLLTLALSLGMGCSFILNPDNSDDVIRCTNADDCANDSEFMTILAADYRLSPRCSNTGAGGADAIDQSAGEQVCVAIWDEQIGCNPDSFSSNQTHPFRAAYLAAIEGDIYSSCSSEFIGQAGCRACDIAETAGGANEIPACVSLNANDCQPGLAVNENGVCAPADAPWPVFGANAAIDGESLEAQDVLDQYCRSFFCDEMFVCDRSTDYKCVPCSADRAFGEGGCGDMYVYGQRSSHYTDVSGCDVGRSKDSVSSATEFGPTPAP